MNSLQMESSQDKEPTDEDGKPKVVTESEEIFGGPTFYPCLYIQRYNYVRQLLCKHDVKSVSSSVSMQN